MRTSAEISVKILQIASFSPILFPQFIVDNTPGQQQHQAFETSARSAQRSTTCASKGGLKNKNAKHKKRNSVLVYHTFPTDFQEILAPKQAGPSESMQAPEDWLRIFLCLEI